MFYGQSIQKEENFHKKHQFLVEVDPIPYALGGFVGHFGWSPKTIESFTFGLSVIGGLEFPDAYINIEKENRDKGWNLKVNQGIGVWAHYYFKRKNKGWFTGLQLFTQEFKLTNDNYPGEVNRTNTVSTAFQIGYLWYPFKKGGLYFRPWGGFGFQNAIGASFEPGEVTKDMRIGEDTYKLTRFMPFATLHIGYRFNKSKNEK